MITNRRIQADSEKLVMKDRSLLNIDLEVVQKCEIDGTTSGPPHKFSGTGVSKMMVDYLLKFCSFKDWGFFRPRFFRQIWKLKTSFLI